MLQKTEPNASNKRMAHSVIMDFSKVKEKLAQKFREEVISEPRIEDKKPFIEKLTPFVEKLHKNEVVKSRFVVTIG